MTNTFKISPQWVAETKTVGWGTLPTADGARLWNFDATEGWTGQNATLTLSGGVLTITPTTTDPMMRISGIAIDGSKYYTIRVRIRRAGGAIGQDPDWNGTCFYTNAVHGESGSYRKFVSQPTWTANFIELDFDMSNLTAGGTDWVDNVITGFRLDFTQGNTFAFEVDSISVLPNDNTWKKFQYLLKKSVTPGKLYSTDIVSTYSLVYTTTSAYRGGVLAPNGEIHFIPYSADRGQKISANGAVSTYSLIYTVAGAYSGGVLAANGEIHFVPYAANRGQKISASGVVSTYSLVYTTSIGAYSGGVVAPNGDIHFVPEDADRGQKISSAGVSTYSLVYTTTAAYFGGVLAPNGDIHFVPFGADRGQKISASGVVSTYSLLYTNTNGAYAGGVLSPNGDIHFIPLYANRGQKISAAGVVSTYNLAYTVNLAYIGGVLSPNGDIHFIPYYANRGQKIEFATGLPTTYSLVYTTTAAYMGGVLTPSGDIHFIPYLATGGQEINTQSHPFDAGIALSPWLNKF